VCVWQADTGKLLWSDHTTHTDIIYAIEFSPDGKTLATAGIDKLIRLWEANTGRLQRTLAGAAWDGISSLAYSPDGNWLASGGHGGPEEGGTVRVWNLSTGKPQFIFTKGGDGFRTGTAVRVCFSRHGKTLFAVGQFGDPQNPRWKLRGWELSNGREQQSLVERDGFARAIAVSPDDQHVAIGTWEGEVVIVSLK
jgi:WD40 repeat protein